MSTHVAMQRPSRIAGLIMCGPAFNCLIPGYWLHYSMLEADQKKRIDEGKEHMMLNIKYGGMKPFRRDFVDNSAKFEIDLNKPMDLPCPVRIIHSIQVNKIFWPNIIFIKISYLFLIENELIYLIIYFLHFRIWIYHMKTVCKSNKVLPPMMLILF